MEHPDFPTHASVSSGLEILAVNCCSDMAVCKRFRPGEGGDLSSFFTFNQFEAVAFSFGDHLQWCMHAESGLLMIE